MRHRIPLPQRLLMLLSGLPLPLPRRPGVKKLAVCPRCGLRHNPVENDACRHRAYCQTIPDV